MVIGFSVPLEAVTTSNHSAIANSHILQFTGVGNKSSHSAMSSLKVAWYRLPTAWIHQIPCSTVSCFRFLGLHLALALHDHTP